MTPTRTPLGRLAAAHGILPAYVDVSGKRRETSPETQRALLAALGIAATTDAEVEDSLAAHEEARARHILGPVQVARGGSMSFRLPVAAGRGRPERAEWQLVLEDGHDSAGRIGWDDLEPAGTDAPDELTGDVRCLPLGDLPVGRHAVRVVLHDTNGQVREAVTDVIQAPRRCHGPPADRRWGVSFQLYGAASTDSWGIGDFTSLALAAEGVARQGGDLIGINPVHALFPGDPGHYGPYGPSSRTFLNPLYIDVTAVPEFAECAEARRLATSPEAVDTLSRLQHDELVDYPAVSALKFPVLRTLHAHFRNRHLGAAPSRRGTAFRAFQAERGEALRRHAIFEALHTRFFAAEIGNWHWRTWPAEYRNCNSAAIAAFAREAADDIEFHEYIQWLADEQLAEAQVRAHAAGMAIGLFRDLAVGTHDGGSAAWSNPDVVLSGATIGAPPDALAPQGQNWGLAALSPEGLKRAVYEPFANLLRANMRNAGALRIDHVMSLKRLFWVPAGGTPADGAYVTYPFEDMLGVLTLESVREECVVVGEDLGTVPEGFRESMDDAGILGTRVLYFEQEDGAFQSQDDGERDVLVTASTHDLPTVRGWSRARDVEWRERLSIISGTEAEAERRRRAEEVAKLLERLHAEALLDPDEVDMDTIVVACHRLIARSPARLMLVQAEDLAGVEEQANLPGTYREHPNWCRRLPVIVEALLNDKRASHLMRLVAEERAGRK